MLVPGSVNPLLLTSAAGAAAGGISRSIRLNAPDSAYLSRTPGSAGNRRTWTWAGWVKRSAINLSGANNSMFSAASASSGSSDYCDLRFEGDSIQFDLDTSSTVRRQLTTVAVFRDPAAWYHVVCAMDSDNATAASRLRIWVNNQEQTLSTTLDSGVQGPINNTVAHRIGGRVDGSDIYFSGYLADIYFIDGQALDPSSFTETDATTGQLIPKAFTGSYGTNGFHLEFSDNSGTTSTTLGKDSAGSNNWTPNNFSVSSGAGNDSLVDVPTNGAQTDTGVGGEVRGNYCTLNPLNTYSSITLSNGNLDYSHGSSGGLTVGTIGVSTGKWYWEHVASTSYTLIGLYQSGSLSMGFVGASGVSLGFTSGGFVATSGGPTYVNSVSYGTSDVIGFALNMDAGTLTIYKNGSATSLVFSGLTGTWFPAEGANSTSSGVFNFGARSFAYTAPSGFKALCTANLPAPLVTKASTAFDVKLYTGNGSTNAITGLGFSPDLVWLKARDHSNWHDLYDQVRGRAALSSNVTNAERTLAAGKDFGTFDSNGFTLLTPQDTDLNGNGNTYAAWCWDAGSSTVTNTQGSITSSVRANATAGFSIVTYTGNGTNGTSVGHGLGVVPGLVLIKRRDAANQWRIKHGTFANNQNFEGFSTSAVSTENNGAGSAWYALNPTSTIINLGNNADTNANGGTYVAYCFAPVVGYSSFGSYGPGNASTDGPFVFTGFRPKLIIFKRYDSANGWVILDAVRNTYNYVDSYLEPNTSSAEFSGGASGACDFLSNGFKVRSTGTGLNASGGSYIYAAFAESPLNYSRAR